MIKPGAELLELDEIELAGEPVRFAVPILRAAERLAQGDVVALRIHPVDVAKRVAVTRAELAVATLRRALVEWHGLPAEVYVESDEESHGTPVAPFQKRRFLLPHQDGGHCSFLTPSRLDHPDLEAGDRVYSSTVYWRRPSHKIYQGFLITNPGVPPGVTYYYDALTLLWDAYEHQHGRDPAGLGELAQFTVENLRRSRATQSIHRSRYLTFGALLGSPDPVHHLSPSGPRAESEFWPAQYINLPRLCELSDRCPCGGCAGPGARLLCDACVQTLGRTWPEVRTHYETAVLGQRYDLLMGNNLTQFHAAESHMSRTIQPMCIVMDRPEGEPYERWLAAQWRKWYASHQAGRGLLETV